MSDTVKLIIEIPKRALEVLNTTGVDWLGAENILSMVAEGVSLDEMTNWEVLKSIFPYAEIVGGDEKLTAVRLDSNPKVGTPIALYTEWLNAPYSTEPKVRDL